MSGIVSGALVGEWVASKMDAKYSSENCTAIGLQKEDGEIVAGVMFEKWNGKSIMAHMAVTGRLTRSFIGAIFRYAYEKCGVDKVILPVSSENGKSNAFVRHLGFTEEARIKEAVRGGDMILYTLSRSDCRFLGDRYVA